MTSEPVGLALAGCGDGAVRTWGPVLSRMDGCRLIALWDSDQRRLKSAAKALDNAPTYTDLEKLLGACPDVEALLISSPVYLHSDQVLVAAKAGKHVLCEGPMARTRRECDEMDRACHQNGVVFMLGMTNRFDRSYRRATELVESGQLGRLIQIRCEWSWPQFEPEPRNQTRRSWGGLFQRQGSQMLDLACWWAGEVVHASASVGIWLEGRQVEDQAVVTLEHTSGAVSLHHMTRVSHVPRCEVVQIDGSKGSLVLAGDAMNCRYAVQPPRMSLYRLGEKTDMTLEPLEAGDEEQPVSAQHVMELKQFCRCIREDKAPEVGAAQGRHVVEVVNAAYVSAATDRKVALPLDEEPNLEQIFRDLLPGRPKIKPIEP